ncbi:hypothetical protein DY78_GL002541 [Lactiplantibacillus fabifermentans DSM 21115]|nr:hypothetical protein DY78_GL002541 [Lactiplantibacillus fabifermentans DSM 21115]
MSTNLLPKLTDFTAFTDAMPDAAQRDQFVTVLNWVTTTFPQLTPRFAWNQPMFTDHGTFIIGFSVAKAHFNVALEAAPLDYFREQITAGGDHTTKMLWQINYDGPINYDLLTTAIKYNLTTKKDVTSFWRPKGH